MKKIIFTLFLLTIFMISPSAKLKFSLGQKVPNMHIESVLGNQVHNGIPFALTSTDGKIVYCINPFEKLNTEDYYQEYDYNSPIFNITDEQLNKMNLIAYYGYGYYNHTDLKWYGISQFLIWKTLNLTDIYFTDTKNGKRINAYGEEIKELESLVNSHETLPSFSNNHYDFTINSEYSLIDLNNVLKYYEILESDIDAEILNNELKINTEETGNYKIKFIRKSPVNRDYIIYGLENFQPLLYPGKVNDIEFSIDIEVMDGSITLNKVDSENIDRVDANLKGAVYGIYQEDKLLYTLETDEKGYAYIDNLLLGKYYIKEISPSIGYELDENIYEVNLTSKNRNSIVISYENVIKGNLVINKYYGSDNSYKLEDGAIFELYDSDDNLIRTYETCNGKIDEEIEYGEYYLLQKKGIDGYKFIDKFNLSVKDRKDYIFDLYDEREILVVEVPNTLKNSYNKQISFVLIFIGSIITGIGKVNIKKKATS